MKGTKHTQFKDGTTLQNVGQATYLGITLDEKRQTNFTLALESLTHWQPLLP